MAAHTVNSAQSPFSTVTLVYSTIDFISANIKNTVFDSIYNTDHTNRRFVLAITNNSYHTNV